MDVPRVLECIDKQERSGKDLSILCPQVDYNLFASYETQKFPVWVYKMNLMSQFGVFVEALVKYFILKEYPDNVDKTRCNPFFISLQDLPNLTDVIKILMSMSGIDDNLSINKSLIAKIKKDALATSGSVVKDGAIIIFDFEINNGKIQGHPDILWAKGNDIGILDVKTVSKPSTNAKRHVVQISAYAALLKERKVNVCYFGLYYPLHKSPLLCMNLPHDWSGDVLIDELTS